MNQKKGLLLLLSCIFCWCSFAQTNTNIQTPKKEVSNSTIIDQLKNGEQYGISINSSGCFHQRSEVLQISRKNNQYTLVHGERKKILKQTDLNILRKFEKELLNVKKGLCTTTDTYVISYGSLVVQYTDGSCRWQGGVKLMAQLWE